MAALVLKKWKLAEESFDDDGTQLEIVARQAGLVAFFLALIRVDPTVSFRVTSTHVLYREASFAGQRLVCVPLCRLSRTYYGYVKPWRESLILLIVFLPVFGLGLLIGPLYYFLNRTLSIGFTDVAGVSDSIDFKRSVLEGVHIDEHRAAEAIALVQRLADQQL